MSTFAFSQRLTPLATLQDGPAGLHDLFLKAAQSRSGWYIASSDIAGQGIFAAQDFDTDEVIGLAMTPDDEDEYGAKIWNLTPLARYCNHQWKPNTELKKQDGQFYLVANKPIGTDDEIIANYAQVTRAVGPHSRMQWEGKDIPVSDLQDYLEKDLSSPKSVIEFDSFS
jgi:hypothetical protein